MKELTLYLADDCHECAEVSNFVKSKDIDIKTIYMGDKELENSEIFVYPALKLEGRVVAYGLDIIKQLEQA